MPTRSVDRRAFIYVIGASKGALKIGVATDPQARLKGLQDGNPLFLSIKYTANFNEVEAFIVEGATHEILADRRARGEWFNISLRQAVTAIQQALKVTGIREQLSFSLPQKAPTKRKVRGLANACEALGINYFDRAKEDISYNLLIYGPGVKGAAIAYGRLRSFFEERGIVFDDQGRMVRSEPPA